MNYQWMVDCWSRANIMKFLAKLIVGLYLSWSAITLWSIDPLFALVVFGFVVLIWIGT